MMTSMPPGSIMILAAFLLPFIPHLWRQVYMLAAIVFSANSLFSGPGIHLALEVLGFDLILYKADALSFPFAVIFHIAALLNVIYSWHDKEWRQHWASLSYAGSAIAALHAGDLVTLFFWWEATAVTSVFLILAGGTETSRKAAMRYLLFQVTSGVILLAGAALLASKTGNITFERMELNNSAGWLIFVAFGIKAAFPFLNGWLQDAYPESTATGTVALSAFTTKLAIYALARGFPGTELLIWIGAAMTALPVFFAVIENDLRRVLSFSLNNQLGFMVVAVGVGTELAINGATAHAFVHIIYKALLFMSMGAVLHQVGTVKASELGGLYRQMPFTMICCIIGAMSISAFPLFSGFVAKSLTMSALGDTGIAWAYFILLFASAGVLEHSGIKIPYFAFFSHQNNHKTTEAPIGMRVAMGIAALLCIVIGVFPTVLYDILPYSIDYYPYDLSHVNGQLQLLVFASLAFILLIRFGFYPPEIRSVVLNSDWFYRALFPRIVKPIIVLIVLCRKILSNEVRKLIYACWDFLDKVMQSPLAGPAVSGRAVFIQAVFLMILLFFVYA